VRSRPEHFQHFPRGPCLRAAGLLVEGGNEERCGGLGHQSVNHSLTHQLSQDAYHQWHLIPRTTPRTIKSVRGRPRTACPAFSVQSRHRFALPHCPRLHQSLGGSFGDVSCLGASDDSKVKRGSEQLPAVSRSSSPSIGLPPRSCVSATPAHASRSITSFTCHRNTRPRFSRTPPCAWR